MEDMPSPWWTSAVYLQGEDAFPTFILSWQYLYFFGLPLWDFQGFHMFQEFGLRVCFAWYQRLFQGQWKGSFYNVLSFLAANMSSLGVGFDNAYYFGWWFFEADATVMVVRVLGVTFFFIYHTKDGHVWWSKVYIFGGPKSLDEFNIE